MFFPKGFPAIFMAGLIHSIFPPLRGKYYKQENSALLAAQEILSEVEGERAVNITSQRAHLIFTIIFPKKSTDNQQHMTPNLVLTRLRLDKAVILSILIDSVFVPRLH